MSCVINDRIFALRNKMQENNIGIYIVPTNDYHSSEYVAADGIYTDIPMVYRFDSLGHIVR